MTKETQSADFLAPLQRHLAGAYGSVKQRWEAMKLSAQESKDSVAQNMIGAYEALESEIPEIRGVVLEKLARSRLRRL